MLKKHQTAFTLIELLVVIAIIGLLASIVLVALNQTRAKARDTKRVADLKQIQTALELFYDTYNRYPITAGHQFWDGHWMNFQTCLETGVGCGFVIANYQSPMPNVPQDPQDSNPEVADNGKTYYYSWAACSDQMYILRTQLETNHPILSNDADGNFYGTDGGCVDPFYCIKMNWCY